MKFLNSCILFSSAACVQAAALSDQIFLSCERSDYDHKVSSEKISPGVKTTGNKSFLDSYFGNFLDGVADAVTIKGKHEPLPLPDHVRNLAVHDNYEYPDPDDLRDINGSTVLYRGGEFGYIDTFAHLPLISCFDPELYDKEPFDIAVIGAPFDSGVSYRPGARFGPSGIRLGSRRLAPAYSVYNEKLNPYKNWAKIVDCGSPPVTPLDNRIAIDQIYRANRAAGRHSVTKNNKFKHPKIVTLGGDHTITLPAVKAAYENWGKISVIHFDSHLDTWNPYYFGGNVTEYQSLNHGTYLHWAHEKGLLSDTSIHAAIRGPYPGKKDVEHDISCGFDRILARDIDKIGTEGIIKKIKERVGDSPVYITVDVDSMDPSTAPASGTVEPGGWTSRELLTILDGLEGINLVGGDVVEVSPPYDTAAEITSVVAAQVADSIISLMVLQGQPEDLAN